jgi:isoquinoline 1-oxidoreductase subunit beta
VSDPFKTNRRCFVQAISSASAGLMLGFHLPTSTPAVFREGRTAADQKVFAPNAYLRIDPDGTVMVTVAKTEIGQGVRTSLPMIVAEELEADWSRIRVKQATPGPEFRSLGTGGSWSIGGNWLVLRKAGATAREMLISAAAAAWSVDRATCRAENGSIVHTPTGRRLGYGDLAEAASKLPVPTDVPFKSPKDYRLIGKRLPRIDGRPIVTGAALYGIDTRVPGMRFAAIARPPAIGGKVARWDAASAKAIPGVRSVVEISSGVAVIADSTWAALRGRDALQVVWNDGPNAGFECETFRKRLAEAARQPGVVTRSEGEGAKALVSAARRLEALYEFPFQAHAPVEPMNCIADVRADRCELWVPTQAPERVRDRVAERIGLPPTAVKVNVTLVGGGFGRRLGYDYAVEAAELGKALKEPVQVLWSRQDDFRHGHFQPASAHFMAGGIDDSGKPVAWSHTKAGSYLSILDPPSAEELKDPDYFRGVSWGAFDVPYSLPSLETSYVMVDSPVTSGPWRAVFSPPCTFARECFLDEMAHAAGKDPLQFRLDLLEHGKVVQAGGLRLDQGRLKNVLRIAAEKAGWGKPLAKNWGRGVAANIYDGDTCVAYVAEVSVDDGRLRVRRIVCAVDCGIVVNPSGVEAQIEGGIAFGLSTVLGGEITLKGGRVEQGTYRDYPVVRIDQMPVVEIHIVPSEASPTGMGEPPVPPVAPAVVNALFAATGKRVRRLPIR